ncbi:hypothetical protein AVEN_179459-1 [Araneus ventricosus]|uniref:Tc1-like transposase DDE domain-containing protein n=1 Tax=Araneus ventricosus TaxID=182803 RepID=A0A4Y2BHD3_ARAVE|nr:hypothetical protein AVEN_179459-1 [Araneus ventricosus]
METPRPYHQERHSERHSLRWCRIARLGRVFFVPERPHVQSVTMTGHIYQDVILEQHKVFVVSRTGISVMDDNARPHRANIVDRMLHRRISPRMDWPATTAT